MSQLERYAFTLIIRSVFTREKLLNWFHSYDRKKNIPSDIVKELQSISQLHEQAVCNYDKCREFSESLSELLVRLEDMKLYRMADKLMSILINCKPKAASHCEKATLVGENDERGSERIKEGSRTLKIKGIEFRRSDTSKSLT